jgi:HEAT repeat protein
MIPTAGTRTTEFPKRNDLPAPKSPPARSKIPVRALAILLEGNTSLATHDAVPDLIIALEKGDERLRARAADALGNMGQNASLAVDALKSGLKKDKNMRVRSNCALALGKIGPKARSAIRLLRKAAKNDHADLRLSAQTALENLTREED